MKSEAYLRLWVRGLYDSQDTFPGKPMTLREAKRELETIKAHSSQYMDIPEGITPDTLMRMWNMIYNKERR